MSTLSKAMQVVLLAFVIASFMVPCAVSKNLPKSTGLWAHENLIAWVVTPFDAKARGSEERADMLARLGFKNYAYNWHEEGIAAVEAEVEALKRHGVNLLATRLALDADDPRVQSVLEVFKRHDVHPQLWVPLPSKNQLWPKSREEWNKLLPQGLSMPETKEAAGRLSQSEQTQLKEAVSRIAEQVDLDDMPKTHQARAQRLAQETDRIQALVKLAQPYGVKVSLYNHNGWSGIMDNQVAIIEQLKERGITSVGIVYNFSHSHDALHDESKNFAGVWNKIKSYVVAVNVSGVLWDGQLVYPSQGDSELSMMRVIQDSGWQGPVGVTAEKGGDAEVTLKNSLMGLDWLAAELKRPGTGGPRPFPKAP